jgi:hypothetical protein
MKFEEFYDIKLGLPDGKLPTFAYQVMCPFGTIGEEIYGSIRPTQKVHVYSIDYVGELLAKYLHTFHEDAASVSVSMILDKGTTAQAVSEYIQCVRPIVTIGTGVVLAYHPGHEHNPAGIRTVSAFHRPPEGDEVYAFANDIEKLRKGFLIDNTLRQSDVKIYAGPWTGDMVCMQDLIDKYPHRFDSIIAPKKAKDDDDEMDMGDYVDRIKSIAKSGGSHIREIKWVKKGVDITLGNCHVTMRKRPNSIKLEAHAQHMDGSPLHNVATAERTIQDAITDFMGYETHCAQIGFGHYDRSFRTQYNCREMMKWMKKLAKKYDLLYTEDVGTNAMHPGDDEFAEISWLDGEPAIRMNIKFLHAEFEFDHINRVPLHTLAVYHNSCEKDAKTTMEMFLADAYRKALNGE